MVSRLRRGVSRGRSARDRPVGAARAEPTSSARPTIRWHFSPTRDHGLRRRGCGVSGCSRSSIATGDVELEILSRAEGPEVAFATALENGLIGLAGSIQQEVAGAPLWQRRYEAADRSLRVGLAFHSDHGLELYRHYVLSWLALCALEQGRWDEAVDWADEVIRTPRASISPRILALTTVGLVRARRGDPDPWSPLDEAYELAIPSGEPRRIAPPSAARAEAAWLEGRDSEIAELTDGRLRTRARATRRRDHRHARCVATPSGVAGGARRRRRRASRPRDPGRLCGCRGPLGRNRLSVRGRARTRSHRRRGSAARGVRRSATGSVPRAQSRP